MNGSKGKSRVLLVDLPLEFSTASAPPSPQWEMVQEANPRGSCSLAFLPSLEKFPSWVPQGSCWPENSGSEGAGKTQWGDSSDPQWSFWRRLGAVCPSRGILLVFMWQNQTWGKDLGVSEVKQSKRCKANQTLTSLPTGVNVAQLLLRFPCQLFHGYHPSAA